MDELEYQAQQRKRRAIEKMAESNRLKQLHSYKRQTSEAWDKLINSHGAQTPEDKRRYTLAYNGLRRLLKKILHCIVP